MKWPVYQSDTNTATSFLYQNNSQLRKETELAPKSNSKSINTFGNTINKKGVLPI